LGGKAVRIYDFSTKSATFMFVFYTIALSMLGGLLYTCIELSFRGRTHISMFLLGGICFGLLSVLQRTSLPFFLKCFLGALMITTLEYCFGLVCNLHLRLGVWDYSKLPFSLHGQICLRYSIYWFFLTIPAFFLCKTFDFFFFHFLFSK
jgi:uncharacterized membrane protein